MIEWGMANPNLMFIVLLVAAFGAVPVALALVGAVRDMVVAWPKARAAEAKARQAEAETRRAELVAELQPPPVDVSKG